MNISKTRLTRVITATAFAGMFGFVSSSALAQTSDEPATELAQVVENYADIGLASYQDSLNTAVLLRTAIEDFLNNPTDETLEEARTAWRTARIPYEQSEVFALGNPVVMAWVDRVNAWPITEGFIDYIDADSVPGNTQSLANIIGTTSISIDGSDITIDKITPEVISQTLHHAGGESGNVASGYHAIEFLLWGQDLVSNLETGVDEGAGLRPASDYDLENCTNSNCDRRGEYLYAAANLLVDDLEEMVANWQVTGEARRAVIADPEAGLSMILTGMGSLSYGELAGNRMQQSVLLHDPNSEQDRFSNNTHISYLFNARGVVGVYFGEYYSMDGNFTSGTSIADLIEKADPELDEKFRVGLGVTMARMRLMIDHARDIEAYDLMIAQGNETGNQLIQAAVDGLVAQSEILTNIVDALDLEPVEFLGSDALDNPAAISQ